MTEQLHLVDPKMIEHHVPELNLVWGMRTFPSKGSRPWPVHVLEVQFFVPGSERPVYLREQIVEEPQASSTGGAIHLTTVLASILTSEAYRQRIANLSVAVHGKDEQ